MLPEPTSEGIDERGFGVGVRSFGFGVRGFGSGVRGFGVWAQGFKVGVRGLGLSWGSKVPLQLQTRFGANFQKD